MSPLAARVPDERRRLIADRLRDQGSVSVSVLTDEFGISAMTVRRDLEALERQGLAQRTHGGAILPSLSSREDSFFQRLKVAVEEKERLADAALGLLSEDDSIFVDSSTTAYFAVRRIIRENFKCTLLTNAAPVVEMACESDAPSVEVIGIGGSLRKLTRSFVGPQAVAAIKAHFADKALFSVRGLTHAGQLTDPDQLEAEIKRSMIVHARRSILLADTSKLDRPALSLIAGLESVDVLVTTGLPEATLAAYRRAGAEVRLA